MEKNFWNIVPTIIAFILIVSILGVLLSIIYQDTSSASTLPPIEQTSGNEPNNDTDPNDQVHNDITPYYTEFPKQPKSHDFFLFFQTIKGNGDIHIKAVHQTSSYCYVIMEADTDFGDIAVECPSIVIAQVSFLGVIEKMFTLPSYLPLVFLSSQITNDGFTIMCHNEQNTLIFNVDLDLNECTKDSLPFANDGRLFLGLQGVLILSQGTQSKVYKKKQDTFYTTFLPSGNIVEIYDFYTFYLIFINSKHGYYIIKLSNQLKKLQETYVENITIKAVSPYLSENRQYFLIAEQINKSTSLWKYGNDFCKSNAIFKDLGTIDKINILPSQEKIITIFSGDTKGIYTFDDSLNCTLINTPLLQNIQTIVDNSYIDNKFYLLCNTVEGLVLVSYSLNNSYNKINIDKNFTSVAFFDKYRNGTIIIYYQAFAQEKHYINIVWHNINE